MILSSDIRKHFTGIECDQLRRLENKTNDNMSFGTTLDDLTTVASSYPSTRGEYLGETTLDDLIIEACSYPSTRGECLGETTLADLIIVACSYPSTRGEYLGETIIEDLAICQ